MSVTYKARFLKITFQAQVIFAPNSSIKLNEKTVTTVRNK